LYDLKDTQIKKVVGTVIISAMGLPGGGRALPTNRLLRFFSLIAMPDLSEEMMVQVFGTILEKGVSDYDPIWSETAQKTVKLSVSLF
jgi:dynein heavy chain